MASAWQTMEEAALTLGVSSRTLHRRITRGEVETRLNHGRREVLVEAPAPVSAGTEADTVVSDMTASAAPEGGTTDQSTAEAAAGSGLSVLALHEDRIRRTDMAIAAYQQSVTVAAAEARRWRNGARAAWSIAAAAMVGVFLVGIWSTHRLTAASAQVENLSQQVRQLSDQSAEQMASAERLRRQAESAQIDAARAQGELSAERRAATMMREVAAPTTRPTATTRPALSDMSATGRGGWMQRLAAMIKGR